ncbi:MAG TPA: hypothetical protein EYP52_05625, partial [Anaerolineae bacterium]|nr:hypothetical protein [Anaerolineae bacterium]
MDERAMARVVEVLETDPDFYVPVKKLWLMLQGEGLILDLDLDAFQAQLEQPPRGHRPIAAGRGAVQAHSLRLQVVHPQGVHHQDAHRGRRREDEVRERPA